MLAIRTWLVVAMAVAAAAPVPADTAPESEIPRVMLSRQLATAMGLEVGQTLSLARDGEGSGASEFLLVGTYEPTPDPFRFTARRWEARLHLEDLRALKASESGRRSDTISRINVKLHDPSRAEAIAREIAARGPGLVARPSGQVDPEINPFLVLERFHQAIAAVTMLGSTAFLLSLMIIRSDERRETAGVLRLIGFARPRILTVTFVEGLIIATVGAVFGLLVAVGLEDLFNRFFQWRYDTALIFVRVTPSIAIRCVAVALPLGLLAGVVASWTLMRRTIMSLLRR